MRTQLTISGSNQIREETIPDHLKGMCFASTHMLKP